MAEMETKMLALSQKLQESRISPVTEGVNPSDPVSETIEVSYIDHL